MKLRTKVLPTVCLIEDDLDDQYMFKEVLSEQGINVDLICFENGFLAHQELTARFDNETNAPINDLPELILLDLNLPVWDGKKTLSVFKQDQRLQAIPILIYTTSKSEYDVSDCYRLGANSFISKAAEYKKLQEQIKSIFSYWFTTVSL